MTDVEATPYQPRTRSARLVASHFRRRLAIVDYFMRAQTVSTRPLLVGEGLEAEAILHDAPGEGGMHAIWTKMVHCLLRAPSIHSLHCPYTGVCFLYASTHINCSFLLQLLRACTKQSSSHAHVSRCQWLVLPFRQFPLLAMTNGVSTWHTCCCTTSTICHHLDSALR